MFRSTPLQVLSVVKIAPGSGAAKIFPQRKHPTSVIINANLVFISVLVCLSYFLIPWGGHSHGDPRSWLVRGGRCCDRPGKLLSWNGIPSHQQSTEIPRRSSQANVLIEWLVFVLGSGNSYT